MAAHRPTSPAARLVLGLVCIAGGAMPMPASFDLGPLDAGAINGPRWLGFLAGAVFMAGRHRRDAGPPAAGQRACPRAGRADHRVLRGHRDWIAFGPGPRECTIAVGSFLFNADPVNDIACRAGFAAGAVLLDGIVLWIAARSLRTVFVPGALPNAAEKAGIALMLLALAPVLLPLLLFGIGKVFVKGFVTRRARSNF